MNKEWNYIYLKDYTIHYTPTLGSFGKDDLIEIAEKAKKLKTGELDKVESVIGIKKGLHYVAIPFRNKLNKLVIGIYDKLKFERLVGQKLEDLVEDKIYDGQNRLRN